MSSSSSTIALATSMASGVPIARTRLALRSARVSWLLGVRVRLTVSTYSISPSLAARSKGIGPIMGVVLPVTSDGRGPGATGVDAPARAASVVVLILYHIHVIR